MAGLGFERWTKKTEQRFQILILFSKEFFADLFRFKLSDQLVVNYRPKTTCVREDPFSSPFCAPFPFFSQTVRLGRAFARKGKPCI